MIARVVVWIGALGLCGSLLFLCHHVLRVVGERGRVRALQRENGFGFSSLVDYGDFKIDRTEVTVEAYRECVADGVCTAPGRGPGCTYKEPDPGIYIPSELPLNCVDWEQAAAFCAWAGRRLPTSHEWDTAAMWSNSSCVRSAQPPVCNADEELCVVDGEDRASNLCDNLSEWTATLDNGHRETRGPSWADHRSDDDKETVVRHHLAPTVRDPTLGFRCGLDDERSIWRAIFPDRGDW